MGSIQIIYSALLKQGNPLSLGFAGMVLAVGFYLVLYGTLSRFGLVGSGRIEKENEELRKQNTALSARNSELAERAIRFEERARSQDEQILRMEEDYRQRIKDEQERVEVFVRRAEQIANLENSLRTGGRHE